MNKTEWICQSINPISLPNLNVHRLQPVDAGDGLSLVCSMIPDYHALFVVYNDVGDAEILLDGEGKFAIRAGKLMDDGLVPSEIKWKEDSHAVDELYSAQCKVQFGEEDKEAYLKADLFLMAAKILKKATEHAQHPRFYIQPICANYSLKYTLDLYKDFMDMLFTFSRPAPKIKELPKHPANTK